MEAKVYSEEYVQINGIDQYFLHYPLTQKDVPVVIFVHGGPGSSSSSFGYELKKYWDFCHLVYYDQRGAIRTLKKNKTKSEDLTIEVMIADLKETVAYVKKKYQTSSVILLGQSWGSVLGTQFVLKYPKDVVAFVGTGVVVNMRQGMLKASYDRLQDELMQKGATKDLKKLEALGDYPNVGRANFHKDVVQFQKIQSKYGHSVDIGKMIKLGMKSPVFKLSDIYYLTKGSKLSSGLFTNLLDYDILAITEYQLPLYYILGRDDWQTPSTTAADYFETITAPKKGLYWIENAGHLAEIDNPPAFVCAFKEIISQL